MISLTPPEDFRSMPKLRGMGKSHRAGNHRAYRWVPVMQPPWDVREDHDGNLYWREGWRKLGKYNYEGPIMSSIYHHHTALARHIDGTIALRWRCQAVKCKFAAKVLT